MRPWLKRALVGLAGAAALAVGGSAIASAASSSSHPATATTSTNPSPPSWSSHAPPANMPAPGTAAHEDAEKAVTGSDASKAQAAAVKSVGSGTAGAVTTDYFGTGYEVTVTKSDGSSVDVHLDSSFNAMQPPAGPPHSG